MISAYERKLVLLKKLRTSGKARDVTIKPEVLNDWLLQNKGPYDGVPKPKGRPVADSSSRGLKNSLFLKETKSAAGQFNLVSISPIKSMAGSKLNQLSFGLFHSSFSLVEGKPISHVGLSDLYLNEVLSFNISAPLKFLRSSPQYDDIFAVSVTHQDTVLLTTIRMINLKAL